MGNTCLHRQSNQKQKILKINGYPKLNCPNKLILEPRIQNIQQNLDTFEEDFFKSEFIFDFQPENERIYSPRKGKKESTIEEIYRLNFIECPSHLDEKLDFEQDDELKLIMNLQKDDQNVFLQCQSRKHQKKKKKQPVSLQKIEKPKGILKTNKKQQNLSFSGFYCVKSQRTVTFSLASYNSKNSRSLSPLLTEFKVNIKPGISRSMTYLQQFPYL